MSKKRRNGCEMFHDRARELMANQNQIEAMAWEQLRGHKLRGFEFRLPPDRKVHPRIRNQKFLGLYDAFFEALALQCVELTKQEPVAR